MNTLGHTLVIGGAGYIGSHLVQQLLATGRRVTVLGRKPAPLHALPLGANYLMGDFGQPDLIRQLLDQHTEVIHLAYSSTPNTRLSNPLTDLLENLTPAVQLFSEVARRGGKLVFVSSGGTVYGEAITLPITENHPTKPISQYGVTKLTLEHYAHLYAMTEGLKFVCVRPANAFGEGQRPFTGQGFISTAMASAMRGQTIHIFGQHGTVRDYLYVTDLAAGILSALEHGHSSEIYNLGSGLGLSNREVIDAMRPLMTNREISISHLPERPFDVKANILDATKLQQHTGWKPQVEFKEGLHRTFEWLRRFHA